MDTIIKKKAAKKSNIKTNSFESFERKINLPDEKISADDIMKEVKEVRYGGKK